MQKLRNALKSYQTFPKPLIGDWFTIFISLICIVFLFKVLWVSSPASKIQIRLGDKIYGSYSLNQHKDLHIHGHVGDSIIQIKAGKVRFKHSPCSNQYCVHQGWLTRAGQTAICLPNHLSLELLGHKSFDTLNY